jgi:hypothetical protein
MTDHSFFHLTTAANDKETNPILDLTPEEFDTFYAEACPLNDALHDALNAYAAAHPGLSLMAVYIAADMLRGFLKKQLDEADADA